VVTISLSEFVDEILSHMLSHLPSSRSFSTLRYLYYSRKLKKTTGKFISCIGFYISVPENISIGSDVFFSRNVFLGTIPDPRSEIVIGDCCMFAMNVTILAGNHGTSDTSIPMRYQKDVPERIVIEDDCWIGAGVVITKTVTIGRGSIIGANSVVTHDIPPYSVCGGVPCRVIKSRI